jgi:hypothetical protein
MSEEETIQVRVELEGDLLKKAKDLRKFYGVERYADLVRLILTEKHREISNEAPLKKLANAEQEA